MTCPRHEKTWRPFRGRVCFSLANRSFAIGYFTQSLRDGWPRPRHLLPFSAVTAVEQLTFVAPAQMKPGLESKARIMLFLMYSESQAALQWRAIGTRTRFSAFYADPFNQC
jgi:hypothetical protein